MRFSIRRVLVIGVVTGLGAVGACDPAGSATRGPTTLPTTLPAGPDGKVHLSDAQWRARLTPEQYEILREKGTERPFTGAYWDNHAAGEYRCAACGQPLFTSTKKFDSGCGWPSFTEAVDTGAVLLLPDADGERTEVECSRCGGHLGHVFDDGPPPTGKRFCIDSAAVVFVPATRPAK
jgi:peptide-methionine (R)-S-oxide reductase